MQSDARRNGWGFRVWGQMAGLRASHLELVLQIVRGNLDVPHGHPWVRVAKEFQASVVGDHLREGYARADHFTCVGVSKLVRNNAGGDTGRCRDFVQVIAQLAD